MHPAPVASPEEGWGPLWYLVEFSGNKFSTSRVQSFHNYNLKAKSETGEINERSGISYFNVVKTIVRLLSFCNRKRGGTFLENKLRGLY